MSKPRPRQPPPTGLSFDNLPVFDPNPDNNTAGDPFKTPTGYVAGSGGGLAAGLAGPSRLMGRPMITPQPYAPAFPHTAPPSLSSFPISSLTPNNTSTAPFPRMTYKRSRESFSSTSSSDLGSITSEVEWDEWEDGVLESVLVHPFWPLTDPYPPSTLPDSQTLDELTNQIINFHALRHSDHFHSHSHSQAQASSPSKRKPERDWNRTWKETRARLFEIARLESKGLGLGSGVLGRKTRSKTRAGARVGSGMKGTMPGTLSNTSSGLEAALGGDRDNALLTPGYEESSIPFHSQTPLHIQPAHAHATPRVANMLRPGYRRVDSMDFLDDERKEQQQLGMGLGGGGKGDGEREGEGMSKAQRLGQALHDSTIHPPTTSPTSPISKPRTPPRTPKTHSRITRLAPGGKSKPSPLPPKSTPRPRSLLQRGRSYTAGDLEDSVGFTGSGSGGEGGEGMQADSPLPSPEKAGAGPMTRRKSRPTTPVRESTILEEGTDTEISLSPSKSRTTTLTPLFRRTFSGFDMEDSYAKRSAFLAPREGGSPEPRLTGESLPLTLQAGSTEQTGSPKKGRSASPARKSRRLASGIKLLD